MSGEENTPAVTVHARLSARIDALERAHLGVRVGAVEHAQSGTRLVLHVLVAVYALTFGLTLYLLAHTRDKGSVTWPSTSVD